MLTRKSITEAMPVPLFFGSKPEGRHKPTLRERAADQLKKITDFKNKRLEEGRAASDKQMADWHERDKSDRWRDAGRHSDYGSGSDHLDQRQQVEDRHQQMLDDERERNEQYQRQEEERQREFERSQQGW